MLISIIGSPCSGKTTSVAKAFAYLKDQGILVEFISEQARWYIAKKRINEGKTSEDKIALTSGDQVQIMRQQLEIEETLKKASGSNVIVLSDSSSLNALLYMDDETRESPEVKEMTQRAIKIYDIVFHTKPLNAFPDNDPNRIHDHQFSLDFDKRIPDLAAKLGLQLHTIENPFDRENLALWILERRCEG